MNINQFISIEELKNLLDDFNKSGITSPNQNREITKEYIASIIDHTILKPDATLREIDILCRDAVDNNFASVCINPIYVQHCFDILKSSNVKVCTVVGFPLGANLSSSKLRETEEAIKNGAEEIDMVINIGKLKEKDYQFVYDEVAAVSLLAKKYLCLTKVILETCLLTDEEIITACLICKKAEADFVKTSTGFSKSGATRAAVSLMKYVVGDSLQVKASGGIKSFEDAINMIKAGATRLGTSASLNIISG